MAEIKPRKEIKPTVIDTFKGVNYSGTAATLKTGEAVEMTNMRVTDHGGIEKRDGYQVFADLGTGTINAMWYGEIAGAMQFIVCKTSTLYKVNLTDATYTSISSVTGSASVKFMQFGDKLYVWAGTYLYEYDGTTLSQVTPYRPTLYINGTGAAGTGTAYEERNRMSPNIARETFNGNGSTRIFYTSCAAITSVTVRVNGATVAVDSGGVNGYQLSGNAIVFGTSAAPTSGIGNIEVDYTATGAGIVAMSGDAFTTYRFMTPFNGKTNNRMFMWGNSTYRIWSGIANGVPSMTYFPEYNIDQLGNGEQITGMVVQYNTLKMFTTTQAFYSQAETITVSGLDIDVFPVFPLNAGVGNVAPGRAIIVDNCPVTLDNGIYFWEPTAVESQTNATRISKRIDSDLAKINLSTCRMIDLKAKTELWVVYTDASYNTIVYVYNYSKKLFYKYLIEMGSTIYDLIVIDDVLYFGRNSAQICRFSPTVYADDGAAITCTWKSSHIDMGAMFYEKIMKSAFIVLAPTTAATQFKIQFITSDEGAMVEDTVDIAVADFGTDLVPYIHYIMGQDFRFSFIQVKISLTSATKDLSIISLILPAQVQEKIRTL